ncbi:hypothetical protein [Maribacter flavus]|uniref:Uncharacterized protein n=1 Tax=Maribacter flavus TaxID=1658664 RepID=A0A5B2TRI9_9FLAO|nr:hypothetical protein [Maribacter flavus]KAA2217176.1 hypothetical protein F0361_14520 [Maribacter flavus]
MKDSKVKEIVEKVFEKAKGTSVNDSKNSLCNHVADSCNLSYKTLERLYGKYIEKNGENSKQSENTVDELCRYLGYLSYSDYLGKRKMGEGLKWEGTTWKMLLGASLLLIGVVLVYFQLFDKGCMTWTGNEYVKVNCTSHQTNGVSVLNEFKLERMKKVDVDAATNFFNEETKDPLIWYYKVDEKTLEYFTDAGKHPVNGETLKAITPYIIEKYVPKHIYKSGTFIK